MNSIYVTVTILLCVCNCVVDIHSLQYSDLEMLGFQNCVDKNSCPRIGNSAFSERICECDRLCGVYDDCCIDAPRSRVRQPTHDICMPYGNYTYQGAYVKACCPSNYDGPIEIRTLCQNGNLSDPILSAPVTDTLNRKTYLNRYCALCNNASPTSLETWLIYFECPNYGTDGFSWDNLEYRSDGNQWGITRQGRFDACDVTFDKPPHISNGLRFCRANLISTCPATYRRPAYKRACESYTSVVTDRSLYMYKNPHCAVCNAVPVDHILCFSPNIFGKKSKPFSFALLLDVNRSDGDRVGVSQACPAGQKYDPFFKKCRALVCAIPGYTMVDGRCVRR